MATALDEAKTLLTTNGYSVTGPRIALFQTLEKSGPLTISEIARKIGAKVDRASVYRAINLFIDLGIAHRVNVGWKYLIELSDTFIEHHHHLTCTNCQKFISIKQDEFESFIERISREYKFEPTAHQIEIQGLCSDCARKSKRKSRKH